MASCTDGVIEAANDAGEEFGDQRLVDLICGHCGLPSEVLLERVMAGVAGFSTHEQGDDFTSVVARGA